jgi:hypothetical protein
LPFPFLLAFSPEAKKPPPIIERVCAFDAKIYKIVGGIFDVSACWEGDKKIFKLFYFCSALPAHLVDFLPVFCLFYQPQRAQSTLRNIK